MNCEAKSICFLLLSLFAFLSASVFLPSFSGALGDDKTAAYSNLKTERVHDHLAGLSPIPVLVKPEAGGTPDDVTQREAFGKDFLADHGGETGCHSCAGTQAHDRRKRL